MYSKEQLLLSSLQHNKKQKYNSDQLKLKNYQYKSNSEFENELFNIKEETMHTKPVILEYKIEYSSKFT
jgi:hypothetical protein